ncbi:hypothetical protein T310_9193, partial [Rasamsonia emersonii CBS 393.64]
VNRSFLSWIIEEVKSMILCSPLFLPPPLCFRNDSSVTWDVRSTPCNVATLITSIRYSYLSPRDPNQSLTNTNAASEKHYSLLLLHQFRRTLSFSGFSNEGFILLPILPAGHPLGGQKEERQKLRT